MIELKLNKSSIFKVSRFIADLEFVRTIEEAYESVEGKELSDSELTVLVVQTMLGLLADSEEAMDELFASLADVEVEEIQSLGFDEYFDLIETFIKAGLLKRALELYKVFQG